MTIVFRLLQQQKEKHAIYLAELEMSFYVPLYLLYLFSAKHT